MSTASRALRVSGSWVRPDRIPSSSRARRASPKICASRGLRPLVRPRGDRTKASRAGALRLARRDQADGLAAARLDHARTLARPRLRRACSQQLRSAGTSVIDDFLTSKSELLASLTSGHCPGRIGPGPQASGAATPDRTRRHGPSARPRSDGVNWEPVMSETSRRRSRHGDCRTPYPESCCWLVLPRTPSYRIISVSATRMQC